LFDALIKDVRYTLRLTRKSPGFFATVIMLLGLGIGLNSAIFSLLDALLLRPLPVARPNELVRLVQLAAPLGARSYFTYTTYRELAQRARNFTVVFAYHEAILAVRDANGARNVPCQIVSGNFLSALGVHPLYGRALTPSDELHASDVLPAVLSYTFWARAYAGDPGAIGKRLTLQNRAFTVVGVMPREFHGVQLETAPDVFIPLIAADSLFTNPDFNSYRKLGYSLVARLRSGITLAVAQAEAESIFKAALDQEFHGAQEASYWTTGQFQLQPIANGVSLLRPKFASALLLLMGGGALLLLIVCANIGGLLLARTAARRGEIAVRLAIGATGMHLVRQWLTETLLLSLAGGILGVGAACAAIPLLVRALPPIRDLSATLVTVSLNLKPNAHLLAFSFLLCLASALLAGLPSAIQTTRHDLHTALKASRATSRQPLRWMLVSLQVALCTVLLSVAGLLVSTFQHLRALDPGFDRDHVVTFSLDPGTLGYTPQQARSLRLRLEAAVRDLPGVAAVGDASRGLMRGTGMKSTFTPTGQIAPATEFMNTSLNWVSPEYFDAMGIRFLAGRNFRPDEPPAKPEPMIVNQAFARHLCPHGDPLGRTFGQAWKQPAGASHQIIGVVSDAKYRSLREAMQPIAYGPWASWQGTDFILHVRTRNDPAAIIDPARRVLHAIDPRLPFDEIHTLAEEVDVSLWPERTLAWLSAAFSAAAAALAALGVFGALAYAIAQMKREIGIRVALGAPPAAVIRLLSAKPVMFAGIGVAAGVFGFLFLAPTLSGLLYGVSTTDPLALTGAAATVLGIVLSATFAAASAALRVNPASVLRED